MDDRMTLEQVRDVLREMNEVGYWYSHSNSMHIPVMKMADAIDSHLAQPAQAVDVGAIREVIDDMEEWLLPLDIGAWRTKLTRAIGNAQAEVRKMCTCFTEGQRAYCVDREKCCRPYTTTHPGHPQCP